MHTAKVITAGLALLAVCVLLGRLVGPAPAAGAATAAKLFIPLWLVAAGINLWIGVSRAGYSVAERGSSLSGRLRRARRRRASHDLGTVAELTP